MMLATVRALQDLGRSARIAELDERIIEAERVTEEEQAYLMPDGTRARVNYFLAWTRTYLKRAGFINNSSRAVWSLTETGRAVRTIEDCELAYEAVRLEEKERSRARRKADRGSEQPDIPAQTVAELLPDPCGRDALGPLDEDVGDAVLWSEKLLLVLKRMDPAAFERLAQRLLRESGFTKVEVRGQTGDGGIDGLGVLRVNLVSFQVYFQCKRWSGTVGAREIRDFRGALQGRADKGLFITTGTYSAQASDEATRDGATAIDLIDGDRLCELLKGLSLGVSTEMIEKVTVDEAWFDRV